MFTLHTVLDYFISPEWHAHESDAPVTAVDGTRIEGAVMRRSNQGIIQYRAMTDDELDIFEDSIRFT